MKTSHFKHLALCASITLFSLRHANGEVKMSGNFLWRGEYSDRTDYSSRRAYSPLRVRPTLTFEPNSELKVVASPQFAKVFGERALVASSSSANGYLVTSGSTFDSAVNFHEGYLSYGPSETFRLVIGRQALSYGDELIVGALEWSHVARAFDALRLRYHAERIDSDFFAAKLVDTNIRDGGSGDRDFYGWYNSLKVGEPFQAADVYALYLHDEVAPAMTDLVATGLRLKAQFGAADLRFEGVQEWGSTAGKNAYQIDFEGGYRIEADGPRSRVALGGFVSGPKYNQMFPTAHRWLGIADVFGRRNISGARLRAEASWNDRWTCVADYHYFLRTSDTAPAYKLDGSTALGSASATSRNLGSEIDLVLSFKASAELTFSGGSGVLLAGPYLKEMSSHTPVFAYLQTTASF